MTSPNPDPAWRLGDEDDFVLEQDDTFGVGDLEGADLPPFDTDIAPTPDAAAPAPEGEDPYGLASAIPHASPVVANDSRSTEQPVPRITIHAACDRPEVADLIAGIAADRRMARRSAWKAAASTPR
ncbi:MAG TPA: hypothetical protein PLS69_14765 [Terricaulis sp.]|mgnify:CR=1 FL=1|nr:hypothetical protein [Terricaulis sp.]